ncbi:MAG: hypothetical protein WED34_12620 [Planctomycetales bacterium]
MSARPGAARSSGGRLESLPHDVGRIANPSHASHGRSADDAPVMILVPKRIAA